MSKADSNFSLALTKKNLSEEVQFESTLLRNGVISPSVEEKLVNIYDAAFKDIFYDNDDSVLNATSLCSEVDFTGTKNITSDTFSSKFTSEYFLTNSQIKTSTPMRIDTASSVRLMDDNVNTTEHILREIGEMKANKNVVAFKKNPVSRKNQCMPKLKKSFKRAKKSVKKGSVTAFTLILTNII